MTARLGRQSLLASGALTAGAAVWTTALALITVPMMVHGLGPADYGLFSVAFSIAAFGSYLDLGLGWTTAKFVAEADATQESDPASIVAAAAIYHVAAGLAFAALVAGGASWIVTTVVRVPAPQAGDATVVLRLAAASFVASSLTNVLVAGLRGLRRFTAATLIATGAVTVSIVGAAIASSQGLGIVIAALAQSIGAVCGTVAALVVCYPLLRTARPGRAMMRQLQSMLGFSVWSYGTRLIQLVVLQFDRVIVARWLGPAAVTFYSVPFAFAQRVGLLAGPAVTAVYPVAAAGRVDRNAFLPQYLAAARLVHITTAALAISVLAWGERFLEAWVGLEMADQGGFTLRALTIGFWLVSVGSFDGGCVEGWNRPRFNLAISAAGALAGLAVAVATYAIAGRTIAVVAMGVSGYLVAAGLGQMIAWYRLSRYPLTFMLRRVGLPVVEMAVAGIIMSRLLDRLVTVRLGTMAALLVLVALLAAYGLWRSMSAVELRALGTRVVGPFLRAA